MCDEVYVILMLVRVGGKREDWQCVKIKQRILLCFLECKL